MLNANKIPYICLKTKISVFKFFWNLIDRFRFNRLTEFYFLVTNIARVYVTTK